MVAISSAVRISCALVVIVMAICSATTVAISESTSAGVALTTLHSPHASATIQRHLKRTTPMEATETSEERAPPLPMEFVFSSMKSLPETISQKVQEYFWPADRIFQKMKLNEVNSFELFKDPRFMKWVTEVKQQYPNKPEAATKEMLATLTKHTGGDVALSKLLVAQTMADSTSSWAEVAKVAADLQKAQLTKWKDNGKTVKDVLEILELHPTNSNPLQDPLVLQLFAFAEHTNTDSTKATKAMLTAFRTFYKDDAAWAKLLFAERDANSEEPFAQLDAHLKVIQVKKWVDKGKTMDELFTLLQLKKMQDKLFRRSLFKILVKFVRHKPTEDANAIDDAIFETLRKNFGEAAELEDVLRAGTEVFEMEDLALDLESKLMKRWLDTGKSLDDVFGFLRLERYDKQLLNEPRFQVLVEFAKMQRSKKHDMPLLSDENALKILEAELEKEPSVKVHETWSNEEAKNVEEAKGPMIVPNGLGKRKHGLIELDVDRRVLSTLRKRYKNDDKVRDIIMEDVTVDNDNVKSVAKGMQMILNQLTEEKLKGTELPTKDLQIIDKTMPGES